jgi:hypothetical protein
MEYLFCVEFYYKLDGAYRAYGGGERRVQDFGGETLGKETTGET